MFKLAKFWLSSFFGLIVSILKIMIGLQWHNNRAFKKNVIIIVFAINIPVLDLLLLLTIVKNKVMEKTYKYDIGLLISRCLNQIH